MSYKAYYKLGNNCLEQTIALTDNKKFISPCNNVYNRAYLYTDGTNKYPEHTQLVLEKDGTNKSNHRHYPEHIKIIRAGNYSRKKPQISGCSSCGTH